MRGGKIHKSRRSAPEIRGHLIPLSLHSSCNSARDELCRVYNGRTPSSDGSATIMLFFENCRRKMSPYIRKSILSSMIRATLLKERCGNLLNLRYHFLVIHLSFLLPFSQHRQIFLCHVGLFASCFLGVFLFLFLFLFFFFVFFFFLGGGGGGGVNVVGLVGFFLFVCSCWVWVVFCLFVCLFVCWFGFFLWLG